MAKSKPKIQKRLAKLVLALGRAPQPEPLAVRLWLLLEAELPA